MAFWKAFPKTFTWRWTCFLQPSQWTPGCQRCKFTVVRVLGILRKDKTFLFPPLPSPSRFRNSKHSQCDGILLWLQTWGRVMKTIQKSFFTWRHRSSPSGLRDARCRDQASASGFPWTVQGSCVVLIGIEYYCMVWYGILWFCMVLHGILWYYMVFFGMAWYYMVS